MGEDLTGKNSLTFATQIKCVRADWIINSEEGILFLKELLRQQNKEIFMTPYIMIVIEFMYKKYAEKIMRRLMPPFMFHLVAVLLLIFFSEIERTAIKEGNL